MSAWYSLYLYHPNDPTQQLLTSVIASGWIPYDPFGLMPGAPAYLHTVKLFVAPAHEGWVRVVCAPDAPPTDALLLALGQHVLCLYAGVLEGRAVLRVYHSAGSIDAAVLPTLAAMPAAPWQAALDLPDGDATDSAKSTSGLPLDVLGGGVQRMAASVDAKQAQSMFDKLAGRVLKGDQRAAAQGLIQQGKVDWASAGGRKVAAALACLVLPDWREPDYIALRDAYQLQRRRQRNANAPLYPGDAQALAAVPDALAYTPVFGGKNDA
ncbi:MAG: hypothetical protein H7Y11_14535 [Armatimonadetes bacterium]|nr:hypothetical protein [Anaerolineae bacterium]